MKKFVCIICNKDIWDYPSRKRKYCSRQCLPKGYMHTQDSRKKMSIKAKERIGNRNNFFGKRHTEKTRQKMRERKLENPTLYWKGKKRPDISLLLKGKWKTEHKDATCATKHARVRKMWGTSKKCEICGSRNEKIYDWSNKDHKYHLVRNNWQRLCRHCHIKWDIENNNYKTHTKEGNKKISRKMKEIWKQRRLKKGEKFINEIEKKL